MSPRFQRCTALARSRQGVAFPVALLGILAVSVTITAVLLSATTETALSSAHQDATRDLYVAQGGLEAYVAQTGLNLAATPVSNPVRFLARSAPATDSALITVRQIGTFPNANDATFPWDTLFTIEAQPIRRGRTVVAMVRRTWGNIRDFDIKAAVTVGADIDINGNTTVSNGGDSQLCNPADSVQYALQATDPSTSEWGNNTTMRGDTGTIYIPPEELIYSMFGATLENLISNATIKFGPSPLTRFGNNQVTSIGSVSNPANPQATPYNWGCPADMFLNNQGGTACENDTDISFYPVVAIDASTAQFNTVNVQLSHGQGMLIVHNGNLEIQGNFVFKGVIIVEGFFDIRASGGGATTPKIEGAVIGLGMGPGGRPSTIDHDITGTPTLRYNRCAINAVATAIQERNQPFRQLAGPTSAWFEVVR